MSRRAREFTYIRPLETEPEIKMPKGKISISEKIIQEFANSKLPYAEIGDIEGMETKGILIGLKRYVKRNKLEDKYQIGRTAEGKIVIKKK
jgi:hypothetical protein